MVDHQINRRANWSSEFDNGLKQIIGPQIDPRDPNTVRLINSLADALVLTANQSSSVLKQLLNSVAQLRDALETFQEQQRTEQQQKEANNQSTDHQSSSHHQQQCVSPVSQYSTGRCNASKHSAPSSCYPTSDNNNISGTLDQLLLHHNRCSSFAALWSNSSSSSSSEHQIAAADNNSPTDSCTHASKKQRTTVESLPPFTDKLVTMREEIGQRKRKNLKKRELVLQQLEGLREPQQQQAVGAVIPGLNNQLQLSTSSTPRLVTTTSGVSPTGVSPSAAAAAAAVAALLPVTVAEPTTAASRDESHHHQSPYHNNNRTPPPAQTQRGGGQVGTTSSAPAPMVTETTEKQQTHHHHHHNHQNSTPWSLPPQQQQQHNSSSPRQSRLRICGVEVVQSKLWTELRERSRRVVQGVATERPPPPGGSRKSMRCYCNRTEPFSLEHKARVIALVCRSQSSVIECFDNGIECVVCSRRDHIDCAIAFACSIPNNDANKFTTELISFLKNYVCIGCRIILVEPFAVVDRILALSMFRTPSLPSGAPMPDPQTTTAKSVHMRFCIPSTVAEEIKAGRVKLQIRGFEVSALSYRFSGFPHQVTFWVNSNCPPGPDFMIKPPVQHRKRKDTPWDIPSGSLRYHDNNTITADLLFLAANPATYYMLSVAVVRQSSARAFLDAVKIFSVVPLDVARSLSRALLDEANRISEEDEVQQVTEAHHVTLTCPSTLMRMSLPGRGFRCLHTQCFDIPYYVESQETVPSHRHRWKCPVCDKPCLPYELFVDSFFKSILDGTTESDRKAYLDVKRGNVTCRVTESIEPNSENIDHDDDSNMDCGADNAGDDNSGIVITAAASTSAPTFMMSTTGGNASVVVDLD